MTEAATQRILIEILKILHERNAPIGARLIADELESRGYSIGERDVRYHLRMLDTNGFTTRKGYLGRGITPKGINEINNALVGDRMDFVISHILGLQYRTTFDPDEGEGDIIFNLSVMDKDDFEKSIDLMHRVTSRGYTVSPRYHIFEEGAMVANINVPAGFVGIATVCSMTIDGVLLKKGIPINTKYGGIIQIQDGKPFRFTDLISYSGTSLDPIKIFMAKRMTDISGIMERNSGRLLSNLREAPIIAFDGIIEIIDKLQSVDIGGLIGHVHAGETVLYAPISPRKIGIPVYAGLNPIAAAMEKGVEIITHPVFSVINYKEMNESF